MFLTAFKLFFGGGFFFFFFAGQLVSEMYEVLEISVVTLTSSGNTWQWHATSMWHEKEFPCFDEFSVRKKEKKSLYGGQINKKCYFYYTNEYSETVNDYLLHILQIMTQQLYDRRIVAVNCLT